MQTVIRSLNRTLMLALPALLIALALLNARRSLADTGPGSTCPYYYGSKYCAGNCSPTQVYYGPECGIQHDPVAGCCQYDAYNIYCSGGTYFCYDQHNYGQMVGNVHAGWNCSGGHCVAP